MIPSCYRDMLMTWTIFFMKPDTTSRINSSTRPLFDKIGRHEAAPSRRNYSIARWPSTDRLVSISNELQIWSRISPLQRELDRNQKR